MNIRHAVSFRVYLRCILCVMLVPVFATHMPTVSAAAPEVGVTPDQLRSRLHFALRAGDRTEAAQTLWTIIEHSPDSLAAIPEEDVRSGVSAAANAGPGQVTSLQILDALFKIGWKPNYHVEPSDYWLTLAQARLEQQDLEGARAAAARITNPHELIMMQADRRFDAIVERDANAVGIVRSAQLQVQILQTAAVEQPRSLLVVEKLARALEIEGNHAEAIKVASAAASAAITTVGGVRGPYDDMSELSWVLDVLSDALWNSGDFDRAVQIMRTASRIPEQGVPNVSQQLNLAGMYCTLGKPDEAAAVIRELGGYGGMKSPFGAFAMHGLFLRIALLKNDHAAIKNELAYVREHQKAGRLAVLRDFVLGGALDDATSWLRSNLADPATRGRTLALLQHFDGDRIGPGEQQFEARWQAWLDSPEVREEVAKWGRINSYPLTDEDL
jgi:tetratricopeptide (TPR) repeat protein